MLRGNASKLSALRLAEDLQPDVEIPGCPPHLMAEAKKEWKRITPELVKYGLVSRLDRAALALYCQAWARWVWAERQLQRAQALAAERQAEAEARGEIWTGGDGMTVATPNGHTTYSPHWVISNRAAEQVHRYLDSFGLSPSSRARVRVSNAQRGLFESDPDAPTDFDEL